MIKQIITVDGETYEISYPTVTANLGQASTPNAPTAFRSAVGNTSEFLEDSNNNQIFEQVAQNGRYLHKIKVIGRTGAGGEIVFYAEPVFEIQYKNSIAQFVSGYAKNILIQGNQSHDVVIITQDNGFKVEVHGPSQSSTDFTAILEIPELVSETLLAIPTIYTLQAGQFDLSPGQTYPLDLVINNGAISGGVLRETQLPDGTYEFVANVKSQQYPEDFEVNITRRFEVDFTNNSFNTNQLSQFDDYEVIVDNTGGASATISAGSHPVTDAYGIYVTATGYYAPSKFEGTLTVTEII